MVGLTAWEPPGQAAIVTEGRPRRRGDLVRTSCRPPRPCAGYGKPTRRPATATVPQRSRDTRATVLAELEARPAAATRRRIVNVKANAAASAAIFTQKAGG